MNAHAANVSAVVVCRDRLAHLKESLPRLMAQPFHEVVVVDFDCPDHTGDWVAGAFPSAKLVRVTHQPYFHLAAARNRGAEAANAQWLFFADADLLLAPGFLDAALPRLRDGHFLIADQRAEGIWGALFVRRDDFAAAGGYDEVIRDWGGEDVELLDRLRRRGLEQATFNAGLMSSIKHSDADRTRHYQLGNPFLSGAINEFYRGVMSDLADLGVVVQQPERQRIYEQMRQGFAGGRPPATFNVVCRQRSVFGLRWATALKYDLSIDESDAVAAQTWAREKG